MSDWSTVKLDRVRNLMDGLWDGREQGGYLLGREVDGEIEIVDVVALADEERRSANQVNLDVTRALEISHRLPAGSGLFLAGSFHCHPPETDSIPSRQDLTAYESHAEHLDRDWVGVTVCNIPVQVDGIYGRKRDSDRLEITATLTRFTGRGFEYSKLKEV